MIPTRQQQIASLTSTVPSIVAQGDSAFEVGLLLPDGKILTLRTELPSDFPTVAPTIRIVDQGVTHPWLDSSGRLMGLSTLYRWDQRTSWLGNVVNEALKEFVKHPPHFNPAISAAQRISRPRASSPPRYSQSSQSKASHLQMPAVPSSFKELENRDSQELQSLLENEEKFLELFNSLSVVENIFSLRDSLRVGNEEKARENLSKSAEVDTLRMTVETLADQLNHVRREFAHLLEEQNSLDSPIDPYELANELEELAGRSDMESLQLEDSMFDDASMLETRLAEYRRLRTEYHVRKAKADLCRRM